VPLVSVVVPTHNRPELLAEALASVRAQTFTDYEIIVVSNGEGARQRLSYDVANAYGAHYYAWPEGNVSAARNFGVSVAKGEWIAFLDDDDLWLPAKLERQLAEARRTNADMIACDCIHFHPDGHETVTRSRIPAGWTYVKATYHQRWEALPSTFIVRKVVLDKIGCFDARQRLSEDRDLCRRISWYNKIYQMNEALVRYRVGHQSLSRSNGNTHLYDLRHYFKALYDTPIELRWLLRATIKLILRWFVRAGTPRFLRQPRKFWKGLKAQI